jgi:Ca-activated chloride channel homolog
MKMRILLVTCLLWAAACGGAGADAPAGDDDGGNVGFGGAQDIGQFRGLLDAGQIPGESTLDANGFFAEHYTELPPADCGQTLCIASMVSVGRDWLHGSYQATLQIALTTPVDPGELPRLPLNLVVVVDRSGSMAEDARMDKVKAGLHLLIDRLEPGDRLAIVQFDDQVDTLSTLAADPVPAELHAAVDAMFPRGATNIYGGLEAGFTVSANAWSSERQNRVILLSDGLATAGVTDPIAIIDLAKSYVVEGTSLSTIGVGLSFDASLMRGLAEEGAGNFYFLEDAVAVNEVFTQELETSLTPLALDVQLAAVPAVGYRMGEAVGTRRWTPTAFGGEAYIPAVFVASRENENPEGGRRGGGGSIYIDMTPLQGAIDDGELASVSLSYRLPGDPELHSAEVVVGNPNAPGELPEDTYVSLQAMMKHYAEYNLFLGLRAATRYAANSYDCAYSVLRALRDSATRFNGVFDDEDITADLALIDQFMENLVAHGARPEANPTQGQCDGTDPYPDDGDYYGDDDVVYGCMSAGKSGGGGATALVLGVAVAFVSRRRRR